MQTSVRIDARDVISGLDDLAFLIPILNRSAVARIQYGLRNIVLDSLDIAINAAGDAFHPLYEFHLRTGMVNIHPVVYETPDGLIAQYFAIENLGNYSDLEEGFHYHALIKVADEFFDPADPLRVELPYGGEVLENPKEERYDFWKAMIAGEPYDVTFGAPGKTPVYTRPIPTAGLYDETIRARVNYWGNKYPEWLLLEYGTDWEPIIPAFHIKYFIEQRVYDYMATVYDDIGTSLKEAWETRQVHVRPTKLGIGQIVNKKGQYSKFLPDNY